MNKQLNIGFYDNSSSDQNLEIGDLLLKGNKAHEEKGEKTKFQNLWLGPFIITEMISPSTFQLQTLGG